MAAFFRKYATATTISIPMVKSLTRDFATNSDWTPATGDVKVSIDAGAQSNIGTLPAYTNGAWLFTFTTGEMTGKEIVVNVVDSATKAVDDQSIIIDTFGHASAQMPFDLGTASTPQTGDSYARIGSTGSSLTSLASAANLTTAQADLDDIQTRLPASLVSGRMSSDAVAISGSTTVADNLETNMAAGGITVATVSDKTGYRLSATGVDDILDEAITEPTTPFTWPGTLRNIVGWLGILGRNKIIQTNSDQTVRNIADSTDVAVAATSDDGSETIRDSWS